MLKYLLYQSKETRCKFLAKVHQGEAVHKIWDLRVWFELIKCYPIEIDPVTNCAKSVITWLTNEHLTGHTATNEEMRASDVKAARDIYKLGERRRN